MRRFLTLVILLCLAIPAGISISGCSRNPDASYCNGSGYGLKTTDVSAITLQPETTGISIAVGKISQVSTPSATTCKGAAASVSAYTYGTTNNQLVDISPSGSICAGTWNRNTGGGQASYTICSAPNPLPSTGSLPYSVAYITASAQSVTSNPVAVYVHAQVTSVSLVGPTTCLSQNTQATLDAQACNTGTDYLGNTNTNVLLCAPASITSSSSSSLACPRPFGVALSSIPSCTNSIGTLSYTVGNPLVASINSTTNVITAGLPGTTAITASVAGSGSSAGYFSTCPPESISVTLSNGSTSGTITQGTTQNLITTIYDTNGVAISGLNLDYQSTDPIDISASSSGAITTNFPGTASVYAVCQPTTCNPAPTTEIGVSGTGLSLASNPVTITTPGTASDYVWFAAPGQSQYFIPVELLTGTVGSTVKLPYVPNSMVMDRTGTSLYFGSSRELMVYSTATNALTTQNINVPGVVLAVSPNNGAVLINDQNLQRFYLYNVSTGTYTYFGGMGSAAAWTPDSKTLYITDSAALGANHTDTLYVYNVNTNETTYDLTTSTGGSESLAITIPSVGAYLSGSSTVAHTWCPVGTVGNPASFTYYPQSDTVSTQTDVLAATTDGQHILGAAVTGGGVTLSDIGVTIPTTECAMATNSSTNTPLSTKGTLITTKSLSATLNATAITQVVPSPVSNLAFITYTGNKAGAQLPYYVPGSGGAAGTVGYVNFGGSAAADITAPIAGAFTPDDKTFFVSTAGDHMIHYIDVPTLTDTQQISPNLPSCVSGSDAGCTYSGPDPGTAVVPATVIVVKPRSTT
jgi:hypothetical protein